MAPKKSLFDAALGKPKASRPINYHPMTTQGKIALYEWRQQNPKKTVPREKPADPEKPVSLPPPGELTRIDEALKLRTKSTRPKNPRGRKPMTTQEKIEAWNAGERAKGGRRTTWKPTMQVRTVGLAKQAEIMAKQRIPDQPTMASHDLGVLYRKTMKSERWAEQHPVDGFTGTFRVMDLPVEVRNRIWKFAVVELGTFISPGLPIGREQPDLAMTCVKIRNEVLPIFYGLNIFGIVMSPLAIYPRSRQVGNQADNVSGIAAVLKWAQALGSEANENGKWLQYAQRLALQYPATGSSLASGKAFIVLVNLNGNIPPQVHRDATCILPAWPEYGTCTLKRTPLQIVDAVKEVQELAGKQVPRAELIARLAGRFQGMRDPLVNARCRR